MDPGLWLLFAANVGVHPEDKDAELIQGPEIDTRQDMLGFKVRVQDGTSRNCYISQ